MVHDFLPEKIKIKIYCVMHVYKLHQKLFLEDRVGPESARRSPCLELSPIYE